MFGFDKDLISDLEVRCWSSSGISRTFIAFLGFGYLGSEFLVQLVYVHYEFFGARGGEIALWVYCDVRVISLVSKEWGYSGGSTRGIVVCKLRKREKLSPVVLLVVAVNPDVLFQCLIGAFGLSIAFRMVTGGEMKLHIESFSERPEEVRDELRSAIGGDV